ncbi:MAG: hypothetical protein JSS27_17710 [Planctomycetes bacterium]|nr:hypothetical protein [Planctomycetota bacterium]
MSENPYQPPAVDGLPGLNSNDACQGQTAVPRTALRCGMIAIVGSVAQFAVWCVTDFIFVRFAPERMNDSDWLLFIPPIILAIVACQLLRHLDWGLRFVLSVGTTFMAYFGTLLLILFLGISFHLAIGGRL